MTPREDIDKRKKAIEQFIYDKKNGETWKRVLFQAPAYAMERLALAMYKSVYWDSLSKEEKEAYRKARASIDKSLRRKDLEYLVKVLDGKMRDYYMGMLSLMPEQGASAGAQGAPASAGAPKASQVAKQQ